MVTITTTIEHDVVDGERAWSLLHLARGQLDSRVDVLRVQGTARDIAASLTSDGRVGLALVESPRQPDTRIARYHGLWGGSPLGRSPDASSTWELATGRAGGVAWIPESQLEAVVEFAATHRGAFIVLEGTGHDPISSKVLNNAFDEDSEALQWGELLTNALAGGWTLVRVLRDEFGLEAQVFDTPDRIDRIWSVPG